MGAVSDFLGQGKIFNNLNNVFNNFSIKLQF